jgi:hypothetical protein
LFQHSVPHDRACSKDHVEGADHHRCEDGDGRVSCGRHTKAQHIPKLGLLTQCRRHAGMSCTTRKTRPLTGDMKHTAAFWQQPQSRAQCVPHSQTITSGFERLARSPDCQSKPTHQPQTEGTHTPGRTPSFCRSCTAQPPCYACSSTGRAATADATGTFMQQRRETARQAHG